LGPIVKVNGFSFPSTSSVIQSQNYSI